MSPRPIIFISSVSKELKSARQLVANTLTFLGYEPEWQDIFGAEQGDLRGMLRRRVDGSQGVVQPLVGHCYGAEPPAADPAFGRCSYTQYEALYAQQRGKKVWYLFLDEHFPADTHSAEPEELRALQAAYRESVRQGGHLRHTLADTRDVENTVLKLRDDLNTLRRGVKRWATLVLALLAVCAAGVVWVIKSGGDTQKTVADTQKTVADTKKTVIETQKELTGTKAELQGMREEMAALNKGVMAFAETQTRIKKEDPKQSDAAVEEKTYAELAKKLGLDAKVLREKLPDFAEQLRKSPDASTYERANATYIAKDYGEVERLAVQAAHEAESAVPPRRAEALDAYELAGNSALTRFQYEEALRHYRAAAALTDRASDPLAWAHQQSNIAIALDKAGKYRESEAVYREALAGYTPANGSEDADVLSLRNNLANALDSQGKYAEAEQEHRTVLAIRERVLGPEHLNTLSSQLNLANALNAQKKYPEAEKYYRMVLAVMERLRGPEYPDTLTTRSNLAEALSGQGKQAEAEREHRAILAIRERVLGAEHPETLTSRMNLANALDAQGKYVEAEREHRAVLAIRERVQGLEHPSVFLSCYNLAGTLFRLGKKQEALAMARRTEEGWRKVLSPDHPWTKAAEQRRKLIESMVR